MPILDKLASSNKGDNFRSKETPQKYGDMIHLMNRQTTGGSKIEKPISVATIQKANKDQALSK
jgi:hypothetical protein